MASSGRRGLICCKVYVSEGRNQSVLDSLSEVVRSSASVALVQRFSDPVYHRSNFTLGGRPGAVEQTAMRLIRAALKAIDLSSHGDATHPRVGVVDHVSLHPLGRTPLTTAKEAALRIGREVGEELRVPVLFYGACNGKPLSEVRRGTGYFKGLTVDAVVASDAGPSQVDPAVGMLCCGAVPYVQNYNLRLDTSDRRLAAQVTAAVRARDGGLPAVEALTLPHEGGLMEVACNLLDTATTPTQAVLKAATDKADQLGLRVVEAYTIGFTGEQILQATRDALGIDDDAEEDAGGDDDDETAAEQQGNGRRATPPAPQEEDEASERKHPAP